MKNNYCLPKWDCSDDEDPGEWTIIHAHDAEDAAEKYTEEVICYDNETAEDFFENGTIVTVRDANGKINEYDVEGKISFYARKRE